MFHTSEWRCANALWWLRWRSVVPPQNPTWREHRASLCAVAILREELPRIFPLNSMLRSVWRTSASPCKSVVGFQFLQPEYQFEDVDVDPAHHRIDHHGHQNVITTVIRTLLSRAIRPSCATYGPPLGQDCVVPGVRGILHRRERPPVAGDETERQRLWLLRCE